MTFLGQLYKFQMDILKSFKKIKKYIRRIINSRNSIVIKESHELAFWKQKKEEEQVLSNVHYEYFYTTHFQLDKTFYQNKVLLDVGCGPRGSLEWANTAKRRIGLDPLASVYLKELGADKHKMEYIASGSESIPLEDGTCDCIFSFNSLDHVEHFGKTVEEIKRCIADGGLFLLLVEVNHPPATCEPHMLSPKDIVNAFTPKFKLESMEVYKPEGTGLYNSIRINERFDDPLGCKEIGWLSAKFVHE